MHRTPQNRRGCIIFWNSNALSQEVLAENGFWHEIATKLKLTTRKLESWGYQLPADEGISSYNIACRISEVLPSSTTPNVVWRPRPRLTPVNIRMSLIFPESRVIAYIFAADSMGLSPFKFVQWASKDASILQHSAGRKRILTWNSRSRSFTLHSVTGLQGAACRWMHR